MTSKEFKPLIDPILKNNPVSVMALGICAALAITVKLEPAIVMALALIFVTGLSNLVISLMRNYIPHNIRGCDL